MKMRIQRKETAGEKVAKRYVSPLRISRDVGSVRKWVIYYWFSLICDLGLESF